MAKDGIEFAKGGNVTPKDKLIKELQRLQTQLNSSRLSSYKEGDNSEEEMARQRERKSKLDNEPTHLATHDMHVHDDSCEHNHQLKDKKIGA